jgi:glycosyltransferase involved in cell wall biosynthesis
MLIRKHSITIITHSFPFVVNSVAGIFIKDQANWLSEIANVTVIAPRPKTNTIIKHLSSKWKSYDQIPLVSNSDKNYQIIRPEYLTYPRKIFYSKVGRYFAQSAIKQIGLIPEVFHVHFVYPAGCIIPMLKKRFPDTPVVLSIHGSDWYLNLENHKIYLQVIDNLRSSDKIIVVGNKLKNDILYHLPKLVDKIIVVPNGIEITDYNLHTINHKQMIQDNKKINILMVGAYTEIKGIRVLLEAISIIDSSNFELTVVGKTPDIPLYKKLCKLKTDFGLDQIVKFETAKPRDVLAKYYHECDFFVLPSLSEGFGIVLIEAMLFGKPVISTCSGGPEDIINKDNGLLIEPGNALLLSNAIKKMLKNYKKYNSNDISEKIKKKYSSEIIVQQLIDVYFNNAGNI